MNKDDPSQISREATSRRRSAWVTIGVATVLVIGTPVLVSQCGKDEDPVVEGQAYANNHYIPGAGYYHSGYHMFFPYRHNFFDAGRGGYFQGGSWSATPDTSSNFAPSVPSRTAAATANSQYRASHPSSRGGFGRTGSFFSGRS
jgi:hypothetical protein